MRRFDFHEMKRIAGFQENYYKYQYYIDPKTGEICLVFDISMEAEYVYQYRLLEDRGIYILVITEYLTTMTGDNKREPVIRVAGFKKEEALEFMVGWLLEKPKGNENVNPDMEELEGKIRAHIGEAKIHDCS